MIPKIVHYTWFSGEDYPIEVLNCINSWKELMPDWEFRLWDLKSVKDIDSVFLREALKENKWAYAADFIRLYALYEEGGIYLDTDVLLYKTLDSFLDNRVFIGKENSIHFTGRHSAQYLTSHCIGAEKGHPFIKDCLRYFEGRHFIHSYNKKLPPSLRYNMVLLPFIQAEIAYEYGYDWRPLTQHIQYCKEGLVIYPSEYFDTLKKTKYSVCKHLALGSWRGKRNKNKFKYTLSYKVEWRIIKCIQWILKKYGYIIMKLE